MSQKSEFSVTCCHFLLCPVTCSFDLHVFINKSNAYTLCSWSSCPLGPITKWWHLLSTFWGGLMDGLRSPFQPQQFCDSVQVLLQHEDGYYTIIILDCIYTDLKGWFSFFFFFTIYIISKKFNHRIMLCCWFSLSSCWLQWEWWWGNITPERSVLFSSLLAPDFIHDWSSVLVKFTAWWYF